MLRNLLVARPITIEETAEIVQKLSMVGWPKRRRALYSQRPGLVGKINLQR